MDPSLKWTPPPKEWTPPTKKGTLKEALGSWGGVGGLLGGVPYEGPWSLRGDLGIFGVVFWVGGIPKRGFRGLMGVSERQSPPTPLNLMGYKGGEGASGGLFRMGWGSHLRAPSRPPPQVMRFGPAAPACCCPATPKRPPSPSGGAASCWSASLRGCELGGEGEGRGGGGQGAVWGGGLDGFFGRGDPGGV